MLNAQEARELQKRVEETPDKTLNRVLQFIEADILGRSTNSVQFGITNRTLIHQALCNLGFTVEAMGTYTLISWEQSDE